MVWAALIQLDAWPASACINVDDAPVGIAASGNEVGLDREAYIALPKAERRARTAAAAERLSAAGADYVIDDVSQLMPVVDAIARRIAVQED